MNNRPELIREMKLLNRIYGQWDYKATTEFRARKKAAGKRSRDIADVYRSVIDWYSFPKGYKQEYVDLAVEVMVALNDTNLHVNFHNTELFKRARTARNEWLEGIHSSRI